MSKHSQEWCRLLSQDLAAVVRERDEARASAQEIHVLAASLRAERDQWRTAFDGAVLKVDEFAAALQEARAELESARRVISVAKRFVPDPATIQWECREVELKNALASHRAAWPASGDA